MLGKLYYITIFAFAVSWKFTLARSNTDEILEDIYLKYDGTDKNWKYDFKVVVILLSC